MRNTMISINSLHMARWLPLLLFCLSTSTLAQSPALQMRWSAMTQNNQGPGALKDFGMSFDFQRNQIIVFGGIKSGAGQVADTWAFNLTSRTWRAVASLGTKPQPRHYFAYGIDKAGGRDRFVISGGQGSDIYSDVWALDLVTETWTQLAPNGAPGAPANRYGSTGGTWDFDSRYLFVTHGFGKRKRYGDTYAFDLATNTWTEVSPDARRPSGRCLLAGTTLDQNRVVLMGGCGSGGWGPCPGQDAWVFSTATTPQASQSHWTRMSTCPGPRVYPAMAASPGNPNGTTVKQVVLYGGVTRGVYKNDDPGQISLLDVTSSKWVSAMPAGPVPPGTRDGPRMVYIYSAFGEVRDTDYVIMYGGAGHDDMWKLSVDTSVPLQTRECPYVFDLRLFHGLTMFFAWCVFLPIGVFAARFGRLWPNMWWFKIHPWANGLGVLLTIGGLVSGVLMVAIPMISPHAILGFIVCAICFFQPLNAVIRPHIKPGVPKTKLRIVWEYIHKYSGRIGIILGSQQPFLGLIYILAEPEVHILFYIYFALCWSFVIALTVMGFPATSPLAGWCKRTFFPNWMPGPWAKYFGGVNDPKAMPSEPLSTSPTPPDDVAMGKF